MRMKIYFRKENDELLPFDHQEHVAKYFYNILKRMKSKYPFVDHLKKMTNYTFSYIMSKQREVLKDGIKIYGEPYIIVSSPNEKFLRFFTNGLYEYPNLKVGKLELKIENINMMNKENPNGKPLTLLSPLILKKKVGNKIWFVLPEQEDFNKILEDKLRKRYKMFYENDAPADPLIIKFKEIKTKRHKVFGKYYRGCLGKLYLSGNPELVKFAYDSGIGENTNYGFGLLETL